MTTPSDASRPDSGRGSPPRTPTPGAAPSSLEDDLATMRQLLIQQGVPDEQVERMCRELREEVEIMARRQSERRQGRAGGSGEVLGPDLPTPSRE